MRGIIGYDGSKSCEGLLTRVGVINVDVIDLPFYYKKGGTVLFRGSIILVAEVLSV